MKKIVFIACSIFISTFAFAADAVEGLDRNGLQNESSLGIVLTSGNTDSKTVSASQKNIFAADKDIYKFLGTYLRSSSQGEVRAFQWALGLRYERELNDMFNLFLAETASSDRYQGINQRYATDLGAKYYVQKQAEFKWFTEAGYRFARENYPTGFQNLNFLRVYNEFEKTVGRGLSAKWWIEFLPNLTRWKGYQFNTEILLAAMLSEIFSIKSAYQIRYNNEPPIAIDHNTDTTFTTSLVAKF